MSGLMTQKSSDQEFARSFLQAWQTKQAQQPHYSTDTYQ